MVCTISILIELMNRGEAGETLLNLLKRPEFKNSNIWVLKVGNL